jgi:hypothetical protein
MDTKKIALFAVALLAIATAEDYVVVNSMNGLDVLSAVFYANTKALPAKFVASGASEAMLSGKIGSGHDILLFSSKRQPMNSFLYDELKKKNTVTLYELGDDYLATNLLLAERSGAAKFIIIDPSFGQNALSVLPYARKTGSYVIFAYKDNVKAVSSFLQGKTGAKVTLFGYLDNDTRTELSRFSPEVIGKGEDKYEDNIEITRKIMDNFDVKRTAFLSSGEYLEEGMVEGMYPNVLIAPVIPDVTYNFIKTQVQAGTLQSSLLVGQELVVPCYDMRKRILGELSASGYNRSYGIVVKFGQAIAGTSQMGALDMFQLPFYSLGLDISSLQYNKATGKLELIVKSTVDGPQYFKNQIGIKINGNEVDKIGVQEGPYLLERQQTKMVEYAYTMPAVDEGAITADVIVKFGETAKSLNEFKYLNTSIAVISFTDDSSLELSSAYYDGTNIMVSAVNLGAQPLYTKISGTVVFNDIRYTGESDAISIAPGESKTILIPVKVDGMNVLSQYDISVNATYGARESSLSKYTEKSFHVAPSASQALYCIPALLLAAVAGLAAFLFFRSRRSKAPEEEAQAAPSAAAEAPAQPVAVAPVALPQAAAAAAEPARKVLMALLTPSPRKGGAPLVSTRIFSITGPKAEGKKNN